MTMRRDGSGWGVQTAITDTLTDEKFMFRRSASDGSFGPWRTVWTTVNFNPTLKADLDSPNFTGTPRLPANTLFKKKVANSSEGGQLVLERPDAFTSLSQDVVFDINGDTLRIWERGGTFRGVSVNLAAQEGGVGSVIWTTAGLKPASQADAAAGVAVDRFITPAALWSFAKNLGSPSYAVIPGTGLMIQCGVTTGSFSEGQAHTTLPVAFGGGCIAAVAIPQNASSNLATNYFMQVVSKNQDRIVFYANRSDSSSGNISGFEWVAIGRVSGTPDPAYSSGSGGGGGGGGGGGEVTP